MSPSTNGRLRRRAAATAAGLAVTAVTAIALVLVLSGCASGPPSDPPGIVGTITNVTPTAEAGEGEVVMLVEAPEPDPSFVSDKASVRVPDGTPVYDSGGAKTGLSALEEGIEVRVWFEGAVAESYPVQGQAKAVQLTGK